MAKTRAVSPTLQRRWMRSKCWTSCPGGRTPLRISSARRSGACFQARGLPTPTISTGALVAGPGSGQWRISSARAASVRTTMNCQGCKFQGEVVRQPASRISSIVWSGMGRESNRATAHPVRSCNSQRFLLISLAVTAIGLETESQGQTTGKKDRQRHFRPAQAAQVEERAVGPPGGVFAGQQESHAKAPGDFSFPSRRGWRPGAEEAIPGW